MQGHHHILIIDAVHEILLQKLATNSVMYAPNIAINDLEETLQNASVLILRSKLQLTKEWIDKAPKLKYIGRLGSGMDNIDVAYAESKGITCHNAPEGNKNAVAEQTMAMLLSLLSNIPRASAELAAGQWNRKSNQGIELRNLTVGIIGYGHVGSRLAELLAPFGCQILAYDKFIAGFGSQLVREVSLQELQMHADVVTLHVPLNEFSDEMINHSFITAMKKPFYLLNLSRGRVVKIFDLINGLERKKITGVGLDVLPNEKLETYTQNEQSELTYLVENKKVILTPHIAGLTVDSYQQLSVVLGDKLRMWLESYPFVN